MPNLREYKSGSIIYFEGERKNNLAFLLKKGKCSRSKLSFKTGTTENTPLLVGEFFGIKAAMGVLPRDETISVLSDSIVYVFTPQEFAAIISKNVSIIFKMLRAFSNELRHIHHAIEGILQSKSTDPEGNKNSAKLKDIGYYYLKKKSYPQAKYVFEQYLNHYPNSQEANKIKDQLSTTKAILAGRLDASASFPSSATNFNRETQTIDQLGEINDIFIDPLGSLEPEPGEKILVETFNELVDVYKQKDLITCYQLVDRIDKLIETPFIKNRLCEKFYLLKPKIAYFRKNYPEAITSAKDFIKHYGNSYWLWNGLLIIAEAMLQNGNTNNAKAVYEKIFDGSCPEKAKEIIQTRIDKLGETSSG